MRVETWFSCSACNFQPWLRNLSNRIRSICSRAQPNATRMHTPQAGSRQKDWNSLLICWSCRANTEWASGAPTRSYTPTRRDTRHVMRSYSERPPVGCEVHYVGCVHITLVHLQYIHFQKKNSTKMFPCTLPPSAGVGSFIARVPKLISYPM